MGACPEQGDCAVVAHEAAFCSGLMPWLCPCKHSWQYAVQVFMNASRPSAEVTHERSDTVGGPLALQARIVPMSQKASLSLVSHPRQLNGR